MGRDLATYIESNYGKAIENHYIQPFYQPVIRTASRQLCSLEALARWIDPEMGVIYPDEFIPVLERLRVVHLLDACIIRQACARIRKTISSGDTPVPISVNLSRLDFSVCDIFSVVDDIVREYQVPHNFLFIEITESVMAEEKDMMLDIVNRFCSAGYQIWMDDFGSAYSSLNVLKEFSFNELKLDMCFLKPFTQRSRRIATSIVEMAKAIDIHTLAEGVETEEQFRYLRNIGCEKVQGYYFGRPMPYEEVLEHLQLKGIGVELPQDRKYYDDIGQVDFLSSVPFMSRMERDSITTARQLNSIPLAIAEGRADSFSILFYNSAFEAIARETGMFADIFTQELLRQPQPYHLLSGKVINLMDSTRSGQDGTLHFTSHEDYYEMQAKCIAQTRDKYSVLLRLSNLSKAAHFKNTSQLDSFLRRIYALYERITLLNLREDTILPLYTATREDLVSGRKGLSALTQEYAEKYLFPEDREEFIKLLSAEVMEELFKSGGRMSTTRLLRASARHGKYVWKAYTLLCLEEQTALLLVRDFHEALQEFRKGEGDVVGKEDCFSPAGLWGNLVQSDLLRLFWKDSNRKFRGVSTSFLKYYGFDSAGEVLGKNDEELGWHIHPDKYMHDELRVLHEGVTTHNIPGRCMNDGENREILASKTPIYGDDGSIQGLMGYFIDRELLTENDRRGQETLRRDILTGLLNSRGISEEAMAFRDEYELRGVDFARFHISIDDFDSLNEQYGYDFGDKLMSVLGRALKKAFGLTCAVGRFAGHKYVILHQVDDLEGARLLRDKIKEVGASVREIDGVAVTLYLSIGFGLYSEFRDLEDQARKVDIRLMTDHDQNISAEDLLARSSDIFQLFDDLPISYSVYQIRKLPKGEPSDETVFYANHKFFEYGGQEAMDVLGRSVRELYPLIDEEWHANIRRAAMENEFVRGVHVDKTTGKSYSYTAQQIIHLGLCAVTYLEIP